VIDVTQLVPGQDITLKVEPQHITHGVKMSCSRCPIALALLEQLGEGWEVKLVDKSAHSWSAFNPSKGWMMSGRIKSAALAFITYFDMGRYCAPRTVWLELNEVICN